MELRVLVANALLARAEGAEVLGSLGHNVRIELKGNAPRVLAIDI